MWCLTQSQDHETNSKKEGNALDDLNEKSQVSPVHWTTSTCPLDRDPNTKHVDILFDKVDNPGGYMHY